jgi:GNAT superfamily N-acetyltransferase
LPLHTLERQGFFSSGVRSCTARPDPFGRRCFRGEAQPDLDAYAAWLAPRIESGAYVGQLAEHAGQVIGGVGAVLLDWGPTRGEPSGTRARIVNVSVDADWRRQGVGASLLEAVLERCSALGVRAFNLAATPEGRGLYQALGFTPYPDEMILRR